VLSVRPPQTVPDAHREADNAVPFSGPSCGPSTTLRATTIAWGHSGERDGSGERSRRGRDRERGERRRICARVRCPL
jgi:hypothetical protein